MKLELGFGYVAVLALHLVACSSGASGPPGDGAAGGPDASGGSGGTGATGGSGGTGAAAGSGGGGGTCGPGDQDCHCRGGTFACVNNRLTCVCPQECTRSDACGQDAICYFPDGNCGRNRAGYCQSLAIAAQWTCADRPVCGCDGNLHDNTCAAVAARVSPNVAPTSNCATAPLPCSDRPSAVSCYPTQYCMVWNNAGTVSESCSAFDGTCAQPSCACIAYNDDVCDCELLPSGIVRLTCTI